jgi:glycosyltransferase involved in cell wall biosynthesis
VKKTGRISVFEVIGDSSLTGAPRHLLTLIQHLDRRQFVVSVICPPGPLAIQLRKMRVTIFLVPMRGRADANAIRAITKLLKKYQPDIVHTHGQRAGLVGRLAARGLPLKRVHTEHTYTPDFKLDNAVLHWGHLRAMEVLSRFTDHHIAVSEAVKKFLVTRKLAKPNRVSVIYNGIDRKTLKSSKIDTEDYRMKWGITQSDKVFGTVGSLNSTKDTTTLIRAFKRVNEKLPKSKLVIIGSGPLRRSLEKLASSLDIKDKVVFTGALDSVTSAIKTFDIFILPSISEAFGLTLLEAMHAEIPIIATRVGGIPEIIIHNLNGVLVEPKNPKKLAAAILKLLNDRRLQKKIVGNYSETLRKFTADKMAKSTEVVYRELAG